MKTYCAIDFETGCNNSASACAIGLARLRPIPDAADTTEACNSTEAAAPASCKTADTKKPRLAVTETFYSLIKPPADMPILPYFTKIHGIKNADVAAAPTFAELWQKIESFIGDDVLVAHNAPFDRAVFYAALLHYGIKPTRVYSFECTVRLSRKAWPNLLNHRLNTVSDFLHLELNHHEALSDAVACAQIFAAIQAEQSAKAFPHP